MRLRSQDLRAVGCIIVVTGCARLDVSAGQEVAFPAARAGEHLWHVDGSR